MTMTNRQWPRRIGCIFFGSTTLILLIGAYVLITQVVLLTTPQRNEAIGQCPFFACEDVTFITSDDLMISAWYVPGQRTTGIVLVHGIHANRVFLLPEATVLAEAGYHVLMIDLRGHGRSEGNLLTYGYQEALEVRAGVDFLLTQPGVEQVGVLGHSLGGSAVVRAAAADERIGAVAVQSTFSSLSLAADEIFERSTTLPEWPLKPLFLSLLGWRVGVSIHHIDSAHALAAMSPRPLFIAHSLHDDLFGPHHAQTLYDAAPEPKHLLLVEGVGHINPILGDEAAYKTEILDFFEMAFDGS